MRIAVVATVVCLSVIGLSVAADVEAAIRKPTDIPAQALRPALQKLSKDRDFQLVFRTDLVGDLRTAGAAGDLTLDEALHQLLRGTHLTYSFLDEKTVTIIPIASAPVTDASGAGPVNPSVKPPPATEGSKVPSDRFRVAQVDQSSVGPQMTSEEKKQKKEEKVKLEEIVVTGTHIRGTAPESSPLTTYDRHYIDSSGAATLSQFAASMPENFSSVSPVSQTYGVSAGGLDQTGNNYYAGYGFNLHGLGPGATLTLLNGHRIAGGGASGAFVDISMIPLVAVQKLEVLTDGASAIYGADAVAGVVNVVLRRDFRGAETSIGVSEPTHGGGEEWHASQIVGSSWSSGNLMALYEYAHQDSLKSSQRSFIPDQGLAVDIVPSDASQHILLSGAQQLGDVATAEFEGFFGHRSFSDLAGGAGVPLGTNFPINNIGDVKTYGGAIDLKHELSTSWRGVLTLDYSKDKQTQTSTYLSSPPFVSSTPASDQIAEAGYGADGDVIRLGSGSVRGAIGTNFREERLSTTADFFGTTFTTERRRVASAYGELLIPIVEPTFPAMLARSLELSLALRYDHYDDFGGTTNPKAGLLWSPIDEVAIRATYGTSFRPPTLDLLTPKTYSYVSDVTHPDAPGGAVPTLFYQTQGLVPLKPETSRAYTFGIDWKPHPEITASASYFNIRFSDRISYPPIIGGPFADIYAQPALASFIQRPPPLSEVESIFRSPTFFGDSTGVGPTGVGAIFNERTANISRSIESGLDLAAKYEFQVTQRIKLDYYITGSYLFENSFTVIAGEQSVAILNTVGAPSDLRMRSGIDLSAGPLSSAIALNYVNGYNNPIVTPQGHVGSWATVDLHMAYQTDAMLPHQWASGIQLSFSVLNILDKNPPAVAIPAAQQGSYANVGFDPANANAFGRLINVSVAKKW